MTFPLHAQEEANIEASRLQREAIARSIWRPTMRGRHMTIEDIYARREAQLQRVLTALPDRTTEEALAVVLMWMSVDDVDAMLRTLERQEGIEPKKTITVIVRRMSLSTPGVCLWSAMAVIPETDDVGEMRRHPNVARHIQTLINRNVPEDRIQVSYRPTYAGDKTD